MIHPDVKYDAGAECPRFLQFLVEIMDGDWDMIRFLQRLFGYCLIGKMRDHIAPFFHGSGGNGKTTLLELMLKIFWLYGYASGAEMWMRRATRDNMENLIHLMGKRLVTAGEIDAGDRLDENRVKNCTGGDTVRGRDLYAKPIEFRFEGKIIFFGNHKPRITDMGKGIWRRVLLVPFDVTIVRPDDNLSNALWDERDGVFLWLIQGAIGYQYYGLCPPERVKAETEKYKYEQDTVGQFIEEMCATGQGYTCQVMKLYYAYSSWCKGRGQMPKSQPQFGAEILMRDGITKLEQRTKKGFQYSGLQLLNEEPSGSGGQPYRDD
jgi:putative DNA primase/helicase